MAEDIYDIFRREVLEDDNEVREQFLKVFQNDVLKFIKSMEAVYKTYIKNKRAIGELNPRPFFLRENFP